MKERIPLGFIDLESGRKPIYALHDFFLNYTFDKQENWEDLRLIVNIFLEAYIGQNPNTVARLIEDEIIVTTQFEHYMNRLDMPKKQDFKIDDLCPKRRSKRRNISDSFGNNVRKLKTTIGEKNRGRRACIVLARKNIRCKL